MAESSSLALAVNVFTAPNQAFAALKERPRVWLPLLLLIAGYTAASFAYMNSVDLGWYLDSQVAQSPGLTEQQREQAVTAALKLSPMAYGAIGAVLALTIVILVLFLTSLYYTIVSFFSNDGVKLKQWWALCCWCTLPSLLGIVAQLVNLSVNDARFMLQDSVNPISFGNLLSIERTIATPVVQRILLGIDITVFWTVALSVLGYQMFAKSSFTKSVIVVLGPQALIVLIGTLLTLR
jgi:hypothetical protein